MAEMILQINFKLNISTSEYEQTLSPLASEFVTVAGLRWKIWLINAADSEAGGIYLFDDESSTQAFLAGPLMIWLKRHPALSEMSVKQFKVMKDETAITHGPLGEGVRV
jgi:hypothetical protein